MVAERWSQIGDVGLVVGATYPEQLADVRQLAGDLPILLPGIGFQGGDLAASVRAGSTGPGTGLLASSSRADPLRLARRRLRRRRPRSSPSGRATPSGLPADHGSQPHAARLRDLVLLVAPDPQRAAPVPRSGLQGGDADDAGGGAQRVEHRGRVTGAVVAISITAVPRSPARPTSMSAMFTPASPSSVPTVPITPGRSSLVTIEHVIGRRHVERVAVDLDDARARRADRPSVPEMLSARRRAIVIRLTYSAECRWC